MLTANVFLPGPFLHTERFGHEKQTLRGSIGWLRNTHPMQLLEPLCRFDVARHGKIAQGQE
ncbi:hypothetical protein NT2_18_00030 [Caenibius tardaugens NBRC 16725]|uniref:Uncharacterized protein n=1 Tax=Caenibius tardaugens NBRC 16725 TaxID=1219035 RepID=U2YQV7_9SPHN|nr:hypothetical protein NT2_18_00030 [Caenibius tardaugens NBRC 16725]